jgi:glycosyltransferase involved in cell wall biosynthesis
MGSKDVLVTIIVPTKNSSETLDKCLQSVHCQTHEKIEIVIVDNFSSDRTLEIARRYTDKVYSKGPERSTQVNFGVEKASGKYIYRVDSDFILDPNIVHDALVEAENKKHGAILIHNTSDPTVSFWAKVRKFERDMYDSDNLNVAVRFIRKDVFLDVGGFDVSMVAGEDYDLHNRILKKYTIGRIAAKEIHLGEPRTLGEVARKHYYYGKTINLFLAKNKERGIRQVSPLRMAYIRNYKVFMSQPFMTLGFIVYQVVRYSSSILGLAASKIKSSPQSVVV